MATIAEIREKYPQYSDMPDAALADALHSKFYSDIPKTDFYTKIGLNISASTGYGSAVPQVNEQGQVIRQPDAIPEKRSFQDVLVGTGETARALIQGIPAGIVSPIVGFTRSLTGGQYGTQEGVRQGQELGGRVQQAMSYQPKTPTGQEMTETVGKFLEPFGAIPFAQGSNVAALAPSAIRQAGNIARTEAGYIKNVVPAAIGEIPAVKLAREKTAAANLTQSYENASLIEAGQVANKYGLAIDPEVFNSSTGAKVRGAIVGERNVTNMMAEQNQPKITAALKEEVGIPVVKKLNEDTFNEAHASPALNQPYEKVKAIPEIRLNPNTLSEIDKLKREALIGEKSSDTLHIAQRLDDLKADVLAGGDGNRFLASAQQLRKEAQDIYRKKDPLTPLERREANAIMGAADILENVLTDNLPVIADRDAFLKARTGHAKLYQLEEATNLATGVPDARVFAKMIEDKKPISGVARDMGLVAAHNPEVVMPMGKGGITFPRITRATLPGAVGAMIGLPFGPAGSLIGASIGAGVGEITKRVMAKNMLTPEFQAKNALPTDYRPTPFPVNNLRPVTPGAQPGPGASNIVPFDPRNALLEPEIRPNFVFGQPSPLVERADLSRSGPAQLEAPSPQSTIASLRSEEARRGRMAKMAEADIAAAEGRAPRAPTGGGTLFDLDPISGKLRPVSQGIRGATPDTMQDYTATLRSATDKLSSGQKFALDAAEKIAFDKTRVDLAEVVPGFKALNDKAIAEKMMDRAWVQDALQKARQKEAAFAEIETRSKNAQDVAAARASRERMFDVAEMMEENLRQMRPDTSRKMQGPKTRAAFRNALRGDVETINKLAE
jgi:hypothetical protein